MAVTQKQKDLMLARQLQNEEANEDNMFDMSDDEILYSALDTITDDYIYALQLQEELNKVSAPSAPAVRPKSTLQCPGTKTSIVDESWEYVDPTPDIFALFKEFNQTYFWGKLDGVEVRWSPKMTLCAGVCSYERRGGLCSVRLSLPLLKLRPRKDLVQTLLHEMIHAYLFVTQNNKDHDAHGPEFCKHMHRLNKETGANITIYHTFHDEVDLYRQHWWKCNGPCQKRPPYYGILRRATNRAPGPNDPWWKDHEKLCGGSYIKFKEPDGYKDPKKRKMKEPSLVGSSSASPKKAKGPTQQVITPFSGKGHVLGSVNHGKLNSHPLARPATASSGTFAVPSPTGKDSAAPFARGQGNPRSNIASLPSVNKSPKIYSSNNTVNSNVVTFGSRQPLGSNQATRMKSNSSSTVTITQRKPAATSTSSQSTPSTAKKVRPKAKSPATKKGSPSKLQTLRDMFSKMQHSPPKRWSNGKIRGSTVIRHESTSSNEQVEPSTSLGCAKSNECGTRNESTKVLNGGSSENNNTTRNCRPPYSNTGDTNGGRVRSSFNNVRNQDSVKPLEKEEKEDYALAKPKFVNQRVPSTIEIGSDDPLEISQRSLLCECPVCHIKVAESDINQHLDVCLKP